MARRELWDGQMINGNHQGVCCSARQPIQAGRRQRIGGLWMPRCVLPIQEGHTGVDCQSASGIGTAYSSAMTGGRRPVFGNGDSGHLPVRLFQKEEDLRALDFA
jgi:hypothetical protein